MCSRLICNVKDIYLGPGGGSFCPHQLSFREMRKNRVVQRRRLLHGFSCINFGTLPENFSPRSSQIMSPGQVKWPYPKNYLGFRREYSFWGINMKLSGVDKSTSVYKTYISEFRFRWHGVRSILSPHHYKAMRKYSYAPFSESTSGNVLFISRYSYIRPLSITRMRFWPIELSFGSFEVIGGHIRFFFSNFLWKRDKAFGMVPMCQSCTDASADMKYDILG